MKKIEDNLEYMIILKKEYPLESFKYYEMFETKDFIYLFFFYHKLFFPLSHDLFWTIMDRGPIKINKVNKEYKVLRDLEELSLNIKLIENQFYEKIIRTDVDGFFKNLEYNLLIDMIKERRYLNLDDLLHIIRYNNLDEERIRYNKSVLDETNPYTTRDKIALYLYDNKSVKNFTDFLDDLKMRYSVLYVDEFPVLVIPDKNLPSPSRSERL